MLCAVHVRNATNFGHNVLCSFQILPFSLEVTVNKIFWVINRHFIHGAYLFFFLHLVAKMIMNL